MNILIPGLHNSDESHWQTWLEEKYPSNFLRIEQANWDEPDCFIWTNQIERELTGQNHEDLILIGHSIGCMAIAHWCARFQHKIKGAVLVAPTDAEKPNFPSYISGFSPIPRDAFPFPSIVVGSTDDHVTSAPRCRTFAQQWGSRLVMLDGAGHIETKSGFGPWPHVLELIAELE